MRSHGIRQAVMLAGGLGTRLRPLTDSLPKPMIGFHERPFAAYLLDLLKSQGIEEVVFLLGYLSEKVAEYFGDGSEHGISIRYSVLPPECETGTRLRHALDLLQDRFLLLYCDNYWPLELDRLAARLDSCDAEALLTVYDNSDKWTKDNVRVGADGIIEVYDKSRSQSGLQGVDIGFGIFQKDHVASLPAENVSFEKTVYPELVRRRKLAAFVTGHRYYSVGSLARLEPTREFLAFAPAILLDRDGVLNQRPPRGCYLTRPEDFVWLPGSLEALRALNENGYRVFVISNQAGIARGQLTPGELETIHHKMMSDAAAAGGRIDRIYVCPHHWDENCSCRKPKPGMLFQAQRDHRLSLDRTWFLGDDQRDIEAGEAAGCKTGLVTAEKPLLDWVKILLT